VSSDVIVLTGKPFLILCITFSNVNTIWFTHSNSCLLHSLSYAEPRSVKHWRK